MDFQLLVGWEVVEQMGRFPSGLRQRLHACVRRLHRDPAGLSDYQEKDSVGRTVQIHLCAGFAFKYWIDHADRQIKILDMYSADRPRT